MKEEIDFSRIYSFSKLNMYRNCPKQYYFNYLDPEIAPRKKEFIKPRDYKTKGQAVHGAITLFYHLPKEERSFNNLKSCLFSAWFSETDISKEPPIGESGGFNNIEHERKTYKESLILLKNFFELKDINPHLFLIPTKDIRNSFSDYKDMIQPVNEEISVSGKFDRIDELENGSLRIIDFKTSMNNQDCSQLEFYKLLAELNFDRKVDIVSFYYLSSKKIQNFDVSKVYKDEIKNNFLGVINKIRSGNNFYPRRTRFCSHCDFMEICPVFKKS
ncbi:MAG: PD-(D/E)XK nuclease family protein [Candidatus Pacebacteria bacterium]|nr:PD-(D/E)XK nuclease family protein [Candidatus Paceibacterota bacterium]